MGTNFLEHRYAYYYMTRDGTRSLESTQNFASAIVKIGSFDSVEGFFGIYDHLKKPSAPQCISTDYHVFREGITPTWEDPRNKNGGKWIIRLRKTVDGLSSLYWEELLLAIIGEQFGDLTDHICGAVISIRTNDDIISLWNVDANDQEANLKMRDLIKDILQLPNFVQLEYKRHALARNHVWHRSQAKQQQSDHRSGGGRTGNQAGSGSLPRGPLPRGPTPRGIPSEHRTDRTHSNHPPPAERDWSSLRKKS
mmetsp:Transcript_23802/g.30973  ORF Transcript_23802/g.30973 Transcript_23802/m.30973 type:complete len:252 (+) Transcript_23802:39-794(+)